MTPSSCPRAAEALTVTSVMIDEGGILVAEDRRGHALGVAATGTIEAAGRFELSLLSVGPSTIGYRDQDWARAFCRVPSLVAGRAPPQSGS
jgi:hypothetical protein